MSVTFRRILQRAMMLALAAIVVPACSSQSKKMAPVITFTFPSVGASSVPRQPIIYIRFDRAMDPATIVSPATNITLNDIVGPISVTVSYNANLFEARIIPNGALAASTVYQVNILPGVKSSQNISTGVAQFYQFTTSSSADTDRPTFTGVASAGSPTQTTITLTWTAATDVTSPGGIQYDIFMATISGSEDLTSFYQTSGVGTGAVVTGLVANTQYFFIVRARDSAGNVDTNLTEMTATTLP